MMTYAMITTKKETTLVLTIISPFRARMQGKWKRRKRKTETEKLKIGSGRQKYKRY